MKPYAVEVEISGKKTGKEFDTEAEFNRFMAKVEELKQKAPNLLARIIRRPRSIEKVKQQVAAIRDEAKENCIAWDRAYRNGSPMIDSWGKQIYRCLPVPQKPKVFYCPYCHCYKSWEKLDYDNGLHVKGCGGCGASESDFNIKTANGLWRMKG